MKTLFVFVFALAMSFSFAQQHPQEGQQGWYKQESGNTDYLFQVQFTSRDTGYVTGSYEKGGDVFGSFYRTTNGGDSWQLFGPPDLGGFFFLLGKNIGWANGKNGLFRTEDGGKTWTIGDRPDGTRIKFANKDTGWGVSGTSWSRTYDGGKKWLNAGTGGDGSIYDLTVFDSKHMLGVGELFPSFPPGCATLVYDSLGFPRQPPFLCLKSGFSGIDKLDSVTAVMFGAPRPGDSIIVFRTTNRGFEWEEIDYPYSGKVGVAIDFSDDKNGTAVGRAGVITRTRDGGFTWEPQVSSTLENLNSVHFIDSLHGSAVGDKGLIIHTTDAGKSWVRQYLPDLESLQSQVNPQPFETRTTISYELPKAVKVTVRIYDGVGRELQTTESPGIEDAGWHAVEFDGSAYSDEVFYYRIEAYPYVGTGKFTKVAF
jgi:photosystem II stability/assembly factor-like uncharacterized protein